MLKKDLNDSELLRDMLQITVDQQNSEISILKEEIVKAKALKLDEILNSPLRHVTSGSTTPQQNAPGMFTSGTRSFAKASASGSVVTNAIKMPVKTNHVVIIQPKQGAPAVTNSAQTFQVFKTTVDYKKLRDAKITIKGKKMTSKNRVVLSCDSESQCRALCGVMADSNNVEAFVPNKRNPQVQILGIDESIPKEEVYDLILSQNNGLEEFAESKFNVKFEKIDRLGTKFVVAEVEPKLFKKLTALKRVCVGYSLCPVKDRVMVIRCFKCNRFGHGQRQCRNEATCAACDGPHNTANCTQHDVKCSNCDWVNQKRKNRNQEPIDGQHRADSVSCPQYLRMRRMVESQIDFG